VLAGIGKGETAYIQDTTQLFPCGDANGQYLQACADQSLVLSPLIIDQKVQGLLGCSDIQTSPDTVQMNIRAVELVSGMLKSLLQREYLIQNLEERIVERTYQLTTFLDMAILSDQAQNLTDIIQPTLLSISQIGDCDAACVHSIDENRSSLTLIAQLGISSEFLKPLAQISLTDEFSAWLDKSDSFTALGNEEKASVFPAPFYIPGFRAFFSSPLKTGKKSLGLLSCYRVEERPFSPFQATLLNALSDLLGIIVENYRLRVDATNLATVQERQRLAREIHDAVSQSVYSLSLFARSARNSWDEKDADHLIANLSDIEVTAIQAMREMRLLLYQLREVSQEEDIGTTLESRFKQVENRLGILATSDINLEHFLPAHIQHEVWRIIIESLNNSVKHARASHVHVTINCQDHNLYATIQDNGIGFDTQGITPGMGLRNIKSRAVELGGHLDIFSEIGQGTQINLIVPLTCLDGEEGG
jgi:signal transduction histidine kinase